MDQSFIKQYQLSDTTICDAFLDVYKKADALGLTTPGCTGPKSIVDSKYKSSTDLWLGKCVPNPFTPESFRWFEYHSDLSKYIDNYCTDAKLYEYAGKFEMRQAPQLQWYKPGEGFYEWHIDGNHELCDRALVFMTYLNDVPDGGTEFMHQNITTEARKGNTVIFPAGLTHIHRGQISQAHDKYIITGWLNWDNSK